MIRPLEPKDLQILHKWREHIYWPRDTYSVLENDPESLLISDEANNIVLIGESKINEPIGIAQLASCFSSKECAQYSIIIPEPSDRTFGRSRDLLLLSIGSAFYIYDYKSLVVLVNRHNDKLIKMCLKGGFEYEADSDNSDQYLLSTTVKKWMPIWGEELARKGKDVPWFNQNVTWSNIQEKNFSSDKNEKYGCVNTRLQRAHLAQISYNQAYNLDSLIELPPPKVLG